MSELLVIDGELVIRLDGCSDQGTRHEIAFGTLRNRDQQVVVKVERIPGALSRELAALEWLQRARPAVAPRVLAFGDSLLDGTLVTCLVTERCAGSPPTTLGGWQRMGAALADLAAIDAPARGLPRLAATAFSQAHADRLRELGQHLDPLVDSIQDWTQLTTRGLPGSTELVLTHGDPGPGNYLDTGTSGTLVDWEDAQIAPLGLDIARLMFIALLGAGPQRYVPQDHQARARAAASGYFGRIGNLWVPTRDELRWWISVAGIQFIHRRWQLGGQPAPWEQAAEVLQLALSNDSIATTHPTYRP